MITFSDVKRLRKEIVLNSLYISDYKNTLGLDPHEVCDFFDGFVEYMAELLAEEYGDVPVSEYYDYLYKYDDEANLEEWWNMFEECPFSGRKEDENA